jgi:hypothetical protein
VLAGVSKLVFVIRIDREVCIRVVVLDPVAEVVAIFRIAGAVRMSLGLMRLYACHFQVNEDVRSRGKVYSPCLQARLPAVSWSLRDL